MLLIIHIKPAALIRSFFILKRHKKRKLLRLIGVQNTSIL